MYLKIFFAINMALFAMSPCFAGFLEMPDVEETPSFERKTLLTDMDVPGVKYRDPDPEAGPRLNVKKFRLQGVVEYPELGITRKDLIKRVETIRFELMEEDKLSEKGYTDNELGEISDLLGSIEENTKGEHVGPLEVQKLVFLIRDQRRRRGVTLGMIETVADTITRYYRERGFILAKAYIPKQQVRDGVVTLTLLLGDLGSVQVVNNKRYSAKKIASVFNDAIDKPVTNEIVEERLYLINDMPGLGAQGFFSAGKQVGDTELSINVLSERKYDANIRIDNHGSPRTGEERVFGDFTFNNPLGLGDALNVSLLKSVDADGTLYGALRYSATFFKARGVGSLGVSTNEFFTTLGNGLIGFSGESITADASFAYKLKRGRTNNRSVSLKLSRIKTTVSPPADTSDDIVTEAANLEAGYNFDWLRQSSRVLHAGSVSVVYSDLEKSNDFTLSGGNASAITQGDATFLRANYTRLSFNNIPFTNIETRFVTKAAFQYAGQTLDPINQFDLTGPERARGFEVAKLSADDGLYLGADWIFKGPGQGKWKVFGQRLDRLIQPMIILDAAYGIVNPSSTIESNEDARLANIGVGLKLNFGRKFKGTIVIAEPIVEELPAASAGEILVGGENREIEKSGTSVFFDFLYSF